MATRNDGPVRMRCFVELYLLNLFIGTALTIRVAGANRAAASFISNRAQKRVTTFLEAVLFLSSVVLCASASNSHGCSCAAQQLEQEYHSLWSCCYHVQQHKMTPSIPIHHELDVRQLQSLQH